MSSVSIERTSSINPCILYLLFYTFVKLIIPPQTKYFNRKKLKYKKINFSKINISIQFKNAQKNTALRKGERYSLNLFTVCNLSKLSEVLDCSNHLACVAVFVVVPRNNLYLVCVIVNLSYHCLCCIKE